MFIRGNDLVLDFLLETGFAGVVKLLHLPVGLLLDFVFDAQETEVADVKLVALLHKAQLKTFDVHILEV